MDKGLKLLFANYWSGRIWGDTLPTEADYEQAKAEGYMFDPVPISTHDETLHRLQGVLEKVSPTEVANAFLYSLSTRQLQYRSALGSYYYALAIPAHAKKEKASCSFCNWLPLNSVVLMGRELEGYNEYNFKRYKYGGVEHTRPEYALFDLEQFLRLPKVSPTEEDRGILRSILHTIEELPPFKKAGAYRDLITKKKLLRSNKSEVSTLLDILGICGVLSGTNAPCYYDRFVDVYGRNPSEHTNDFAYPVNRWQVSDGVNEDRFRKVFGFNYSEL